jgi:hypothetical protein
MNEDETLPVGFGPEGRKRAREMQLLINVIAPDPRNQPYYLADDATLLSVRDQQTHIIHRRLEGYFGSPLLYKLFVNKPIWQLVDELKILYPGWPDAWE